MAYLVIWDANFNSRPLATDALGNGYTEIQQTRSAIQERLSQEHSFRFIDVSNTNQGKHLQGSARIFVSDTEPADPSTVVADNGDYAVGRMLFKPTLKELLIRTVSGWVNVLKSGLDAIFNSITATNATITNSMVGDGVIKNKTNLSTVEYDQDNLLLLDITDNVLKKATPADIIKGHTDATSVHGATSAPTADRLILRDASGRAQVATPSTNNDIANKQYVDNHINATTAIHGATSAATADALVIRDASGRAKVAAPSAADDIARKDTVDAVQTNLNTHANATTGIHGATSAATADALVIRDASGRAQVSNPSGSADIATLYSSGLPHAPGDIDIFSYNLAGSSNTETSSAYYMRRGGAVRVRLTSSVASAGTTVTVKRNGSTVLGPVFKSDGTNFILGDVSINPGDYLQIVLQNNSTQASRTVYVQTKYID